MLFFIFLLITAGILYAGPNQWTLTEGISVEAFCISLSPVDNNILYSTVLGGYHVPRKLYRSADKGNTWSQITQNNDEIWNHVFCSPESSSILFMTDNSGLHRSINGGYTMSLVTSGLAVGSYVSDMTYLNDTDKTLFVSAYSIYKSTDGGENWSPSSTGMGYLSGIHLSASSINSSLIYATGGNGLYKSIDKGENWSLLTSSSNLYEWRCIRVNPVNPDIVYAIPGSNNYYLHKSIDGGTTWSLKSTGLPAWMLLDIATVPGDGSTLFTTSPSGNGVYISTDTGETWQEMNNGFSAYSPVINQLIVIPGKSPIILAATPLGVYSYTLTTTSVEKELWEGYEGDHRDLFKND